MMNTSNKNEAFAYGKPPLTGVLRTVPEDFKVVENLGFSPDGQGEHVFVELEKQNLNTAEVAKILARFVPIAPRYISYAGRKDKQAVTRQTFSLHFPGKEAPDWSAFSHPQIRIISTQRHSRKLKRGALKGNRFELVARQVTGDKKQAEARLEMVAHRGVPNYFGEQRFGHHGKNITRAQAFFNGQKVDRNLRSILISAARAYVFNAVLNQRVIENTWEQALKGDVWCLNQSRAWFLADTVDATLEERLHQGDIHPSGPLWGKGPLPTKEAAYQLESRCARNHPELVHGLESQNLKQDRRALRLIPENLRWQWQDNQTLLLSFQLPAGSYATTVIRELIGQI